MKFQVSDKARVLDVVKRTMYLAWRACGGPLGMGAFQDRGPGMSEEKVWEQAYRCADYPGGREMHHLKDNEAAADYVFGRMMKLNISWDADGTITVTDSPPRSDYQAWCRKYKTYEDLVNTAIKSLSFEVVTV